MTLTVPSNARASPQVSRKCDSPTCHLQYCAVSSKCVLSCTVLRTFRSFAAKSKSCGASYTGLQPKISSVSTLPASMSAHKLAERFELIHRIRFDGLGVVQRIADVAQRTR